jgi:hypothetical protein
MARLTDFHCQQRQTVKMYKIQCSRHTVEEATWETEHYLNENYQGFLE